MLLFDQKISNKTYIDILKRDEGKTSLKYLLDEEGCRVIFEEPYRFIIVKWVKSKSRTAAQIFKKLASLESRSYLLSASNMVINTNLPELFSENYIEQFQLVKKNKTQSYSNYDYELRINVSDFKHLNLFKSIKFSSRAENKTPTKIAKTSPKSLKQDNAQAGPIKNQPQKPETR